MWPFPAECCCSNVRKQWQQSVTLAKSVFGSSAPSTAFVFIVGRDGLSERERASVEDENTVYDDLVLLDSPDKDGEDGNAVAVLRSSTSIKVIRGIQWAVFKYHCTYVVRLGTSAVRAWGPGNVAD